MYTINLSIEERQTLVDVLECTISELHSEIVHTDRCEFKEAHKSRKHTLVQLLDSLNNNSGIPGA